MDNRANVPKCPICETTEDTWDNEDGQWTCYRCVIDEPERGDDMHLHYLMRICRAVEKLAGIIPPPKSRHAGRTRKIEHE